MLEIKPAVLIVSPTQPCLPYTPSLTVLCVPLEVSDLLNNSYMILPTYFLHI